MESRDRSTRRQSKRFASWLLSFLFGLGGIGIGSLIGVAAFGGWSASAQSAARTAEWLNEVGVAATTTTCEARMLRLTELEIRVTIPELAEPVVLISPDAGAPLRWWPARWETCFESSSYAAPIVVRFAESTEGSVFAIADRDMAEVRQDNGSTARGVAVFFGVVAVVWAGVCWLLWRSPGSRPVSDLAGLVPQIMAPWHGLDWQFGEIVGDSFSVEILLAEEPSRVARVSFESGLPDAIRLDFAGFAARGTVWRHHRRLALFQQTVELAALAVRGPSEVVTDWVGDQSVRVELTLADIESDIPDEYVPVGQRLRRARLRASGLTVHSERQTFDSR